VGRPSLRDEVLARDARELLALDGGVAHVRGEVEDDKEARLLRRALARVNGIYGVWDLIRLNGQDPLRVVDIGCGGVKQWDGAIGIDMRACPGVDVIVDLEHRLPFADASLDYVFAVHVLEHVHDVFGLLGELHRVLKPTGVLHAMVPHWRHVNAVADPTHVRFFDPLTFRHFTNPAQTDPCWEPVAISANDDTVFADLEPVHGEPTVPQDELVARFFA
jgi:SAM-dependent methyltransferase